MRARRNRRLDLSELSAKEVADDQTPLAKGGTGGESAATVTGWNGFHVSICNGYKVEKKAVRFRLSPFDGYRIGVATDQHVRCLAIKKRVALSWL